MIKARAADNNSAGSKKPIKLKETKDRVKRSKAFRLESRTKHFLTRCWRSRSWGSLWSLRRLFSLPQDSFPRLRCRSEGELQKEQASVGAKALCYRKPKTPQIKPEPSQSRRHEPASSGLTGAGGIFVVRGFSLQKPPGKHGLLSPRTNLFLAWCLSTWPEQQHRGKKPFLPDCASDLHPLCLQSAVSWIWPRFARRIHSLIKILFLVRRCAVVFSLLKVCAFPTRKFSLCFWLLCLSHIFPFFLSVNLLSLSLSGTNQSACRLQRWLWLWNRFIALIMVNKAFKSK